MCTQDYILTLTLIRRYKTTKRLTDVIRDYVLLLRCNPVKHKDLADDKINPTPAFSQHFFNLDRLKMFNQWIL